MGHNLYVVTFDLHSAGFSQAKDATRNGIGIDDFVIFRIPLQTSENGKVKLDGSNDLWLLNRSRRRGAQKSTVRYKHLLLTSKGSVI